MQTIRWTRLMALGVLAMPIASPRKRPQQDRSRRSRRSRRFRESGSPTRARCPMVASSSTPRAIASRHDRTTKRSIDYARLRLVPQHVTAAIASLTSASLRTGSQPCLDDCPRSCDRRTDWSRSAGSTRSGDQPGLSPDGKLLAYFADLGTSNSQDLSSYLRPAERSARRTTTGPATSRESMRRCGARRQVIYVSVTGDSATSVERTRDGWQRERVFSHIPRGEDSIVRSVGRSRYLASLRSPAGLCT